MEGNLIRTSDHRWLKRAGEHYKTNTSFRLVDDAKLGINPSTQTLTGMAITAKAGFPQWVQLGGVFGIGATGVFLIMVAAADPEPTSKLGLIVGTGAFLVATGGIGGLKVLTGTKADQVRVSPDGTFEIRFS